MWRVVLTAALLAGCSFTIDSLDGGGSEGPTTDWWDRDYPARMRLSIRTITAVSAGFQLGFPLDSDAAPCTANRDNIRIVANGMERPRVIDEVGAGDEWIWFQLLAPIAANATSDEYWIYCGNPSPPSAPNDPSQVFDQFDNFDGQSLGSAWVSVGAVSVAGGSVSVPPNAGIHTTTAFSPNTAADFVAKATLGAVTSPYFWIGFSNQFSFAGPWVRWFGGYSSAQVRASTFQTSVDEGPLRVLDASPHLYGVENYDHSSLFRVANQPTDSIQFPLPIGAAFNVVLYNHTSGGPIELSMLRVRKTVTPYPTVVVGTSEALAR